MVSFNELDAYLHTQVNNDILPGAVMLIAKEGKVLHEKAYGYAKKYELKINDDNEGRLDYLEYVKRFKTPASSPILMTSDHLFDLASLTKVLATTFAVMLLMDQKQLRLDDAVKIYIPEFNQSDKSVITLRHLLAHSSGLAAWKPLYCHFKQGENPLKWISEQPLAYPVNSKRQYSDLGYIVLRSVIESITKQHFDVFLQQSLYQPLNLKSTKFNPDTNNHPIAYTSHGNPYEYSMLTKSNFGYHCDENANDFIGWRRYTIVGEANDANAHHVFSGISGHAGLFSTAREVNTLLQLVLQNGYHENKPLLQLDTIKHFTTLTPHQHGLGWFMSASQHPGSLPLGEWNDLPLFQDAIGHTGFTGTFVLAVPTKQISLVMLTNVQNSGVNHQGVYPDMQAMRIHVLRLIHQALMNK